MMKSGNLQWKTAIKGHSTKTNQEGRKEKTVLKKKKKRLKRVVILFLKGVDAHDEKSSVDLRLGMGGR